MLFQEPVQQIFAPVIGSNGPLIGRTLIRGTAARLRGSRGYTMAEIAASIGYESDAAFNRMFKREIGTTPGRFKRATPDAPDSSAQLLR